MTDPSKLADELEEFQHMMPEGGTADPLIETFQALAKRAAAALRQSAPGWRPIETAPKDGTEVLVWATPYSNLVPSNRRVVGHYDRGWWDNTGCVLSYVTHWQPLPAPPADGEKQG